MAENSSPTAFFRQIISDEIENGNLILEELDHKKAKVLKDIMECHTPAKGIAMSFCPHCGHSEYHNGSCHNACCPCCGSSVRLKWIEKQQDYVLDARYFHIVFTIPSELNPLCLYDPEFMYNCLFDSVGQTLLAFSDDQKFLGGMPGFYCALHTWGQKLDLHPHIHVIFCAGALTDSGEWVTPKRTTKDGRPFLFPVKALAAKFRGEFMARLNERFLSDEVFDPNNSWFFSQNHFLCFVFEMQTNLSRFGYPHCFRWRGVLDFFKNDGQKLVEIAYNNLLCTTKRQSEGC